MIGASSLTVASDGWRSAGTGPPAVGGRPDAAGVGEEPGADEPGADDPGWADAPGASDPRGSTGSACGSSDAAPTPWGRDASAAVPTLTARRATIRLVVPARARVRPNFRADEEALPIRA